MIMTRFWKELLPEMPANFIFKLTHCGTSFSHNKRIILDACRNAIPNCPTSFYALCLVMAMTENNTLRPKVLLNPHENISIWNLSSEFIKFMRYEYDPIELNLPDNISEVIKLMYIAVSTYGVEITLNFIKGGKKAFDDGIKYGEYRYRNCIATQLRVMDLHPELLYDDQRIDILLEKIN